MDGKEGVAGDAKGDEKQGVEIDASSGAAATTTVTDADRSSGSSHESSGLRSSVTRRRLGGTDIE